MSCADLACTHLAGQDRSGRTECCINVQLMSYSPTVHSCRMCGSSNYRRVVTRDGAGSMRATDLYQCSGCSVVFTDPKAWRDGEADPPIQRPPSATQRPVTGTTTTEDTLVRTPNLATYGSGQRSERAKD